MLRKRRAQRARATLQDRVRYNQPPSEPHRRTLAEQRELILGAIAEDAMRVGSRYRAVLEELRCIQRDWEGINAELHCLEAALGVEWEITEFPLRDRDWGRASEDAWNQSPFATVNELGDVIDFDPDTGIAR